MGGPPSGDAPVEVRRGAQLRRAAPAQVLVEDVAAPDAPPDAVHHLTRVLRLGPGATVCVTDGAGAWRLCELGDAGVLEPTGEVRMEPAPLRTVTVAVALVKGARPELVVQKLTELGVDRIVPFAATRSVVRWDGPRAERHLGKLRTVAVEACAQSRRVHLPEVVASAGDGLLTTAEVVAAHPGAVAAEQGGRPLGVADRTVLIGPEGGWAPGEVDGLEPVGLGDGVLRAETAAITAGALMTAIRAGVVGPGARRSVATDRD